MILSQDMKDLVALFEKHEVKYALIGGYAVIYYGVIRTTQDIDFLIKPEPHNAQQMMLALREFGFANAGIEASHFEKESVAIHLGVEPNRIDLITSILGVENKEIFKHIENVRIDDCQLKIISLTHLTQSKESSKRYKDLADAEALRELS